MSYARYLSAMDNPPFSILIMGTGALGCLFAARLASAGAQVTMSGNWPAGLQALRQYGVRLVETDSSEHTFPVQVRDGFDECNSVLFALVLVKSWQTGRAAQQLAQCLAPEGVALSLQNGLGNYELLAETLGEKRVTLGVTTAGATLLGPGRVRPGGEGKITISAHPRLAPMLDWLQRAGFEVECSSNPGSLLWGKLVINAAINPLTALLGMLNGELLEDPATHALLVQLAQETAAVAAAQGIPLSQVDPVQAAEAVARRTATNQSSMLQDMQRGTPTEIDAICGAIVRAGEQTGIPTPVNWTLWQLVKAKENRREKTT